MSQSPAPHLIRPLRWALLPVLSLGLVFAGLPATSASAVGEGTITGTVTYPEATADRTLEVFREATGGAWVEDASRQTTVASDGTYSVTAPEGEPVKLRVKLGESYGYWYGDGFDDIGATPVTVAAGASESDVDLTVPVLVPYSGRLLNTSGQAIAGSVFPTVNTDGGSRPISEAVEVGPSGEYTVLLPARPAGSWYEAGILARNVDNTVQAWLKGGDSNEPNFYLNPQPGQAFTDQDITLEVASSSVVAPAPAKPAAATQLRATRSPVVRGATRKGAILRASAGQYNRRPVTVRYQWLRNGRAISGATSSAYRVKKADVRKHLSVRVTASGNGNQVRAQSARTATVRAR